MRNSLYIIISLFGIGTLINGCNFLNVDSDHAPEIQPSYFYVNPIFNGDTLVSAEDTLQLINTDAEGYDHLDSITLGDTVVFAAAYYSHEKDLVSVTVEWDSTRMDLKLDINEEISQQLCNPSNIEAGKLYFNPGFHLVSFPCKFTAKKEGILPIKLTIASTSEYSPVSIGFKIPAKK